MTVPRDAAPRVHRRSWGFAALLASLAMLGPFAVDMYLPAFPAIGAELNASQIGMQQTLSVYMFAFAFMMLWHGALSDSLGRRPIVIGGLASSRSARWAARSPATSSRCGCSACCRDCRRAPAWSSGARSSATASPAPRRSG